MTLPKLVRDRIPEIIESRGKNPLFRYADIEEFTAALRDKLREEVDEFLESGETEELVDVLEVVYTLAAESGLSLDGLELLRRNKIESHGDFTEGIILEEVQRYPLKLLTPASTVTADRT